MWGSALTVTILTSDTEVHIDIIIACSPCFLSADLGLLFVQPGSDVRGVTRGIAVGDIIDIPTAGKGSKDFSVAGPLSRGASGVSSSIGTTEDLNPS